MTVYYVKRQKKIGVLEIARAPYNKFKLNQTVRIEEKDFNACIQCNDFCGIPSSRKRLIRMENSRVYMRMLLRAT